MLTVSYSKRCRSLYVVVSVLSCCLRIEMLGLGGILGCAASLEFTRASCSVMAMASVSALIFLDSLDRVLTALRVSESVRTIPRSLVGVPAPMVTDSVAVGARFFAASLFKESADVIVSVSVRSLDASLIALSVIVIVSVRLLTMLTAPAFAAATESEMEIV